MQTQFVSASGRTNLMPILTCYFCSAIRAMQMLAKWDESVITCNAQQQCTIADAVLVCITTASMEVNLRA